MISPTRPAIWIMAGSAPIVLLIGVLLPRFWYAGLTWPIAVLVLMLFDAILTADATRAIVGVTLPRTAPVGGDCEARITIELPAGRSMPAFCEIALASDPLLLMADEGYLSIALAAGSGEGAVQIVTLRRGLARIDRIWLRLRGPIGLVWRGTVREIAAECRILPDVRAVRERGAQLFERYAQQGLLAQVDRGEGLDFDALVEFRSGMDRRAIDWKQSARHLKLHAKEYRSERNSQIVFAIDCGRQMCDPIMGVPRVDRAVSAMLMTAWMVLRLGDRVALHAFDNRPRIASGLISGGAAFAELQGLAADIEYSGDETNYTFALTNLGTMLKRRSMIVLFTEFADLTAADFLVRAAGQLVKTHLLLIVVLRDEALERFVDVPPESADDVTRAVTAHGLLRDRELVLLRLQHLGVHIIESPFAEVAERLVAVYVDLKRRDLL